MRFPGPLLALVLALGLALPACGGEDAPRPGDLIAARAEDQFTDGAKSRVVVPTGALKVWVGEPTQSLAADEVRDGEAFEAAAGTTYVPLSWHYNTRRFAAIARYFNTDATPDLTLRTGDHSYRLPPPSTHATDQSFYVLVDGDAKDLALDVGFEGVTQSVDLRTGKRKARRAKGLYGLDEFDLRARPCGSSDWVTEEYAAARFSCEVVGPMLLPFADGQWAERGRRWLAIDLRTSLGLYSTGAGWSGAHWRGVDVATKVRLGRTRPASVLRAGNADDVCPDERERACKFSAKLFFDVGRTSPDQLQVRQRYQLTQQSQWGGFAAKDDRRMRLTGRVALR